MDHTGKKRHGLRKLLWVFTAVAMCAAFIGQVSTAYAAEVSLLEEQGATLPATATGATVENAVTAADLKEACNLLNETRDEIEGLEKSTAANDILKALQGGNQNYLREDILAAVGKCTEALKARKELEEQKNALSEKITDSEFLSDEEKEQYLTFLETLTDAIQYDPEKELADMLAEMGEVPIETIGVNQYLLDMQEKRTSMEGLNQVLDTLYMWKDIDENLNEVSIQVNAAPADIQEQAAALAEQWTDMKERAADYFMLPIEEQEALAAGIWKLSEDVNSFDKAVVFKVTSSIMQQETQIEAVQNEMEVLQNKMYIISFLGPLLVILVVAMVIVAVICCLRTPKTTEKKYKSLQKGMDTLGSRDDSLKKNIDNVQKKVDSGSESVEKLQELLDAVVKQLDVYGKRIESLEEMVRKLYQEKEENIRDISEQTRSNAHEKKVEPPIPVPNPEPAPIEPSPVCNLKLEYLTYNPASSYLEKDDKGTYVLFEDETVGIRGNDSCWSSSNTVGGWKDSGYLFLFEAEINGVQVDADDRTFVEYYRITKVVSRAKVEKRPDGRYGCSKKGRIRMER